MSGNSLTLSCPNCGEPIALQANKVTKKTASIKEVKETLSEWIDNVDVIEEDDCIVVMPKAYLGKELWYKINEALKPFDVEYVSAGKESRWEIRRN